MKKRLFIVIFVVLVICVGLLVYSGQKRNQGTREKRAERLAHKDRGIWQAMIIRELLTVFGLDYDGKGQKRAEKGIQTLKGQAQGLQAAFGQLSQILVAGGALCGEGVAGHRSMALT